jgi:hypothetical protein
LAATRRQILKERPDIKIADLSRQLQLTLLTVKCAADDQ